MKGLLEALALILLVTFGIAVVFVFVGEPDIWDHLHAAAIEALK